MNNKTQLTAFPSIDENNNVKEWTITQSDNKTKKEITTINTKNYQQEIIKLRKKIVTTTNIDYIYSLKQLEQIDKWYKEKTKTTNNEKEEEEKTKAEIAEEYTNRILDEFQIKTLEDTKELYTYNNETGLYEQGQRKIENLIQHELKTEATNYLVNEIIGRIKRKTYIKREEQEKTKLIPLDNGIYNIKTKKLEEHDPKNFFTTKHPVKYDQLATSPNINQFLFEICENEEEKIWLLEKIAAYCLYRNYPIQTAFMLHGTGQNGKSVYLNLIEEIIGKENITNSPLQQLISDKNYIAELHNKNANIFTDIESTELKQTGMFKAITGGDNLICDKKYLPPFKFKNHAKLIFSCNQIPETRDDTDGFHRRWILVGFNYKIPEEKKIPMEQLLEKLTTEEEKSGWLNTLLYRLEELLKEGKFNNEKIEEKRQRYTQNSNSTNSFAEERIDYDPGSQTEKNEIYEEYKNYCKNNHLPTRTDRSFWKTMHERYGEKIYEKRTREPITGTRKRIIEGLRLITTKENEEKTISQDIKKPLQQLELEEKIANHAIKTTIIEMSSKKEGTTMGDIREKLRPSNPEEEETIIETIKQLKKNGTIYEPREKLYKKVE